MNVSADDLPKINFNILGYDLYTKHNYSLIDSVMFGLSDVCETQRCSGSVRAYGVIDENGLPSLDGMIMRGYVLFVQNYLIFATFRTKSASL